MFYNLRAEMARKGITQQKMAKEIGVANPTLSMKMNGKQKFTLNEANKIKTVLGVNMSIDELFAVRN